MKYDGGILISEFEKSGGVDTIWHVFALLIIEFLRLTLEIHFCCGNLHTRQIQSQRLQGMSSKWGMNFQHNLGKPADTVSYLLDRTVHLTEYLGYPER